MEGPIAPIPRSREHHRAAGSGHNCEHHGVVCRPAILGHAVGDSLLCGVEGMTDRFRGYGATGLLGLRKCSSSESIGGLGVGQRLGILGLWFGIGRRLSPIDREHHPSDKPGSSEARNGASWATSQAVP